MFNSIEEISEAHNLEFRPEEEEYVIKVFNGEDVPYNIITSRLKAGYYWSVKNDIDLAEKNFLDLFKLGDVNSLIDLISYYLYGKEIYATENQGKLEKYFSMGIKTGNREIIRMYAQYHYGVTRNYKVMEEYLSILIESDIKDKFYLDATYIYAKYHYHITENYEQMKKYCFIGIELNDHKFMNFYGDYFYYKSDYDLMEYYYLKAIELGNMHSLFSYINFQRNMIGDCEKCFKYLIIGFNSAEKENLKQLCSILEDLCVSENKYIFRILEQNFKKSTSQAVAGLFKKLLQNSEIFDYVNNYRIKFKSTHINQKLYEKYIVQNLKCDTYINDFELVCENYDGKTKIYYLHSFILNSKYFEILIDGNFERTKTCNMNVSSFYVVDLLIKFLYLGNLDFSDIPKSDIGELGEIADQYGFEELTERLKYYIYFDL